MDPTTNQLLEKLVHLLEVNARDLKLVIASGASSSVTMALIGIGGTLLGAIIGGLIPNISQGINYRKRIKKLKNIIKEELRFAKAHIASKIIMLKELVGHLENDRILPGRNIPILEIGYKQSIAELYNELTPKQRNCLYFIYEHLRIADDVLVKYEQDILPCIDDSKKFQTYKKIYIREASRIYLKTM